MAEVKNVISRPAKNFIKSLKYYASGSEFYLEEIEISDIRIPAITVDKNHLFVFCSTKPSLKLDRVKDWILAHEPRRFKSENLFEIVVSVSGLQKASKEDQVFGRGKRIMRLHDSLAQLLGIQDGWREIQGNYIRQALSPLKIDGEVRLADLYLRVDGEQKSALSWIKDRLIKWGAESNGIAYLRAEAGKGKSTLLAEAARRVVQCGDSPIPLYVPLRNLKRESGISWDGIAACAGVVGKASQNLKRAAKSGLVSLLLDGLDEVAGRYDPNTIHQVEQVALEALKGSRSKIIVSGRTTEATLLDDKEMINVEIELPESNSYSFKKYTELVINSISPKWPQISSNIDVLTSFKKTVKQNIPNENDKKDILKWIKAVFDDLGKEKSLFFIQSLSCIGISYQSENQPFFVRGQGNPDKRRPPLLDVCLLATALACYREQEKVEDVGKKYFSTSNQIKILTFLSILASSEESLKAELPRPNEIAKRVVGVDPVNENEAFIAVTRQLQKHALLFSERSDNARTGDWTPSFLSDWVRSALIVRAWNKISEFREIGIDSSTVHQIVARSEKGRYAFEYIIPELISEDKIDRINELSNTLVSEANKESPEASSNFWSLYIGVREETRREISSKPESLNPFADLSGISAKNVEFGEHFSGTYSFFVESEFRSSKFQDWHISQSDFTHALFENCTFQDVSFRHCDGPITFDNCDFINVEFENIRNSIPGYRFIDCDFKSNVKIKQDDPSKKNEFGPVAEFEECVTVSSFDDFFVGSLTGFQPHSISGLSSEPPSTSSKAEKCLKSLLKRFFERWAGPHNRRQTRDYIRTSSLGRGVWPPGSPTKTQLIDILTSEGFTKGGRQGHLWAPWSGVAGGGASEREIRSELLAYLQNNEITKYVERLKSKIEDASSW